MHPEGIAAWPVKLGESINGSLKQLHPTTRRRLWADHACEIGKNGGEAVFNPDLVAANFRQKQPDQLPDHTYFDTVIRGIESGLDLYIERVDPDRVDEIGDEYRKIVEKAQTELSGGKWRNAMCSWNSDRHVAENYLESTYDCSAEGWVDSCEKIWEVNFDTVLSCINPDYLNSLLAERCATGMTVDQQANKLANAFRTVVAGGSVWSVEHDLALQWARVNIENVNQSGIESFV